MLKPLEHKRFNIPMLNIQLSLSGSYWCVYTNINIDAAGNEEHSKNKRPWYNYT